MGKIIWNEVNPDGFPNDPNEVPDSLPLRSCEDPFLELVYNAMENRLWQESRRIVKQRFTEHDNIISWISARRYPRWMGEKDSPVWTQIEARCSSVAQRRDKLHPARRILFEGWNGEKAHNEEEDERLTQIINEAIELAACVDEHIRFGIDPEVRSNDWPDAYNGSLYSFAFGSSGGLLPQEVVVGYDVWWDMRPHNRSISREDTDPSHLIIDSVFSVSLPVSKDREEFAHQMSLEKERPSYPPGLPAITVPFFIVEYVKFSWGSSRAQGVHEGHLAGAFEVALGMYESLGLELPIFGILVDRLVIKLFAASAIKVDDSLSTEIQYFELAQFYVGSVARVYELFRTLDRVLKHANTLSQHLSLSLSPFA